MRGTLTMSATVAALFIGTAVQAQSTGHTMGGGHGMGAGHTMGAGHGHMMGGTHEYAGSAAAEMQVIHMLLANHERIARTVTNLPDGIRTVTESDDTAIAALLKQHVGSLEARLREPGELDLPMQSDALKAIMRERAAVRSTVELTAKGVIVTQTSADAATVAALQQHAEEVSRMVEGGMEALHEMMMKNHHGGAQGGMMPHGGAGGGMQHRGGTGGVLH